MTMCATHCLMQYPYSWSMKKVQLAQLVAVPQSMNGNTITQLPGDILGNPKAVFNVSAVGATPSARL